MEGGGGWESHTLRPEQLHSISDAVSKDGQLVDVLAPALSEHAVTFTSGKDGRNTTKHDEMKRWFLTNLPEHIATSKSIVDRVCQWFVKETRAACSRQYRLVRVQCSVGAELEWCESTLVRQRLRLPQRYVVTCHCVCVCVCVVHTPAPRRLEPTYVLVRRRACIVDADSHGPWT